jgi:hypothetical protein
MSETCIDCFFDVFLTILLVKKLPCLFLFLQGLFVYVFSISVPNYKKPTSHFLVMREKHADLVAYSY